MEIESAMQQAGQPTGRLLEIEKKSGQQPAGQPAGRPVIKWLFIETLSVFLGGLLPSIAVAVANDCNRH